MRTEFVKLKDCGVLVLIPAIWIDFWTNSLKMSWLWWGIKIGLKESEDKQ